MRDQKKSGCRQGMCGISRRGFLARSAAAVSAGLCATALGSDTGIDDLDALTYVNFLCNEDGMDPISFGATVAAAMELFEAGAITTALPFTFVLILCCISLYRGLKHEHDTLRSLAPAQ